MNSKTIVNAGIGRAAGMALQDDGTLHPRAEGAVQKLLSVQRPAVTAYLRSLRRRHPDATPADIAEMVRSHYVNLTTGGGAAVGATAVIPGIGSAAAIGVAAVETAGFLEGSALYAQAIAELHGLPVRDPERANALVMGLMLGSSGQDLVRRFAGQASGKGPALTANWGQIVAKQIPASMLETLTKSMRRMIVKKYAAKFGGSFVGRVLPFGIGAVIGGVVNRQMAKSVVAHARTAFGPFPAHFEPELDPAVSTHKQDAHLVGGLKNLMALRKQREKEEREAQEAGRTDAEKPSGRKGGLFRRRGATSDADGPKGATSDADDAAGVADEPYALPGFTTFPEDGQAGAHGQPAGDGRDADGQLPQYVPEAPRTYRPDVRL